MQAKFGESSPQMEMFVCLEACFGILLGKPSLKPYSPPRCLASMSSAGWAQTTLSEGPFTPSTLTHRQEESVGKTSLFN